MTDSYDRWLTLVASFGSGLNAGVFFAFSTFVMRALRSRPDREGLAAMQAINQAALTPPFMATLLGAAPICAVLAISALRRLDDPAAPYQLAGGGLNLAGLALTVACHVPRNRAMALLDPDDTGAAGAWRRLDRGWTAWNHGRTLSYLASAVMFTLALKAR